MLLTFAKITTVGVWIIFWAAISFMKIREKDVVPKMFLGNPKKSSTAGIIAFFIFFYTALWINKPILMNSFSAEASLAFSFFGFLLINSALIIGIWSLHELGKSFSASTAAPANVGLTTSGPYGYVRHPIYLMFILIWIGSSMMFIDAMGISLGIILIPLLLKRVKTEEENLLLTFGSEYSDYQNKTGRFFLKLK